MELILIFLGGVLETGHHLYWLGAPGMWVPFTGGTAAKPAGRTGSQKFGRFPLRCLIERVHSLFSQINSLLARKYSLLFFVGNNPGSD